MPCSTQYLPDRRVFEQDKYNTSEIVVQAIITNSDLKITLQSREYQLEIKDLIISRIVFLMFVIE